MGGGGISAALLQNCTDTTDTQDVKQLYQIIYFYNSHFRTLFSPPPPPPPPTQEFLLSLLHGHRKVPSMAHFVSQQLFFRSSLHPLNIDHHRSSLVICACQSSTNCPRQFCPSLANKDKSRTAGMWSREVTETRRTDVNPQKDQPTVSDSAYLCSSSRRLWLPSPNVCLSFL